MNNSNDNEEGGEYYTPYDEANQVNNPLLEKKSTTAMILGLIAISCAVTGFLTPVALILGIIALVKGKKYKSQNTSAKAGYILGIISVIVATVLIIGFVFMISRGMAHQSMGYNIYESHTIMRGGTHGYEFYQNGPRLFQRFF